MLPEFLTSIEKYEKWHERLTEKGNLWLPFFFYEIAALHSQAERAGKYMIRPLLSLERLSFEEKEGQVSYR